MKIARACQMVLGLSLQPVLAAAHVNNPTLWVPCASSGSSRLALRISVSAWKKTKLRATARIVEKAIEE